MPLNEMPDAGYSGLEDEATIARRELFGRAAKIAGGGIALGAMPNLFNLLSPGLALGAGAAKDKKIAVIEQAFGTFFTANFNKPLDQYLKKSQPGWSATFGNENNTVTTGINLLNQYAAANYGILMLSTGDQMSAWQQAVSKVVKGGSIFINHSTQAVTGATQNVLFSHKQAGIDLGNAAVAWAKKNNVTDPVVGMLGNLSDAQGRKRTDWAWKTLKAKIPNSKLAGQAQGIDQPSGAKASANLLSAHPDINMLLTFNTLGGLSALTSATHAGKNNRDQFFLGTADSEEATLKLIAAQKSIYQANWGAFFPASMVMMARDGIAKMNGKAIRPTRMIYGLTITTPEQANSFGKITFDPLNPKYAYVFTKYFKYLDVKAVTGKVPAGA
ncbi:MAG: ribose transport system substrate-binding protein [Gaiellales bacterium]|nr:ribose transport system substrate-binding protein [Gaiellales bacterium]